MSARLPSRWLFAAALLAAEGLTSAAPAQPPRSPVGPPVAPAPQAAPVPAPVQFLPGRIYLEPQLIEEEQVSEHADLPRTAPPAMPSRPHVTRDCGLPECDRDDGKMSAGEMTLRCLLFSIHPLAAFLPLEIEVQEETLPAPTYLQHTPLYCPPCPVTSPVPPAVATPEQVGMPTEVERLDVMPVEAESLDAMPVEEESEEPYQLLGPWTDCANLFRLHRWPLAELKVSVQEAETGSLMFGLGAELSGTGSIVFSAESLSAPKAESAPCARPAVPPQVQLSVLIAEVKAMGARRLNLDRAADGKAPRWVVEVADESRQEALVGGLKGLREKGRAKFIAEPTLMTLSGQQASFLTGGELAVPVTAGSGEVGVRFEEFGTRVTCQPVVLADGTIRLEVEPEVSELCEVAGGTDKGVIVPGRSSQRVHTTADVARGHTLVITGPKAGGDTRLVLLVTPTVIEPPAAAVGLVPQTIFHFGNAVCGCVQTFDLFTMQPCAAPEEETVHDLLVKCRRELSRGHYAAAEDLVQRALERDREQVMADSLVCGSDLLQRVKEVARLPLGTVDPCDAKGAGAGFVSPGEAKAIGSRERMAEALMQEFNAVYQQGKFTEAAALARRAAELDPDNASAAASVQMAKMRMSGPFQPPAAPGAPAAPPATAENDNTATAVNALAQSQGNFKGGRYEEARADALRALAVCPGNPAALVALQRACEALARQPRPETVPQCTYVGSGLRPALPRTDPAVVSALQKLLTDGEKANPLGGVEEAEPKDDTQPAPRR